MIQYKRCSEVDKELTFKGFSAGFADYMIKIQMPEETFWTRFFGPEGNHMEHSFIALDAGRPIGVILGGIRNFDGRKTIRCGGMCVIPEFRLRGVSVELIELHQQEAKENNCRQLFLEVITSNTPAVKFYKRIGYQKVYNLNYFYMNDVEPLLDRAAQYDGATVENISFEQLKTFREMMVDFHINWQNEMEYIQRLENQHHYGIFESGRLAAALSINQTGQFHFLRVNHAARDNGLATQLLAHAVREHQCKKIRTGGSSNGLMECYLSHIGFTRDKISQFEMYLPVSKIK